MDILALTICLCLFICIYMERIFTPIENRHSLLSYFLKELTLELFILFHKFVLHFIICLVAELYGVLKPH